MPCFRRWQSPARISRSAYRKTSIYLLPYSRFRLPCRSGSNSFPCKAGWSGPYRWDRSTPLAMPNWDGTTKGLTKFPHYLVSGGYLEQPAGKTLGNQSVAVGQALRPAGEVSKEGDHRQALVLPHDLAGGRIHFDKPGSSLIPDGGRRYPTAARGRCPGRWDDVDGICGPAPTSMQSAPLTGPPTPQYRGCGS